MKLIKTGLPSEERVLVFVQFPDLTEKVAAALEAHKISFLQIRGSASSKSKALQEFQDPDASHKVLLLNVMDESASGANLTVANHAIFISPLLAPSQEIYEANETQAIGRLQRFGQTKLVHVYRFLTTNSVDIEIFEPRTGIAVDQTKKTIVLTAEDLNRDDKQENVKRPGKHERRQLDYIEPPSLASVGHRPSSSASPPAAVAVPLVVSAGPIPTIDVSSVVDLTMSDNSPPSSPPTSTPADGTVPLLNKQLAAIRVAT